MTGIKDSAATGTLPTLGLTPRTGEQGGISLADAGLRQVGFEETFSVYKDLRDRVNLSEEARNRMSLGEILRTLDAQNSKHLADVLERSAERSARSANIKALADQLYAEVHAQKGAYVEPTPYALIRDRNGQEVGKIGQGGGISLNGDWAAQKDAAKILELIRETLSVSRDDQAAKRLLFRKLEGALGDLGGIERTGVDVVPPRFGDENLQRIQDELSAALSAE